MLNFSEQCMDMAHSILSHNIGAVNQDGSITPAEGETTLRDEAGHVAMALGEFYRATGSTTLDDYDIADLSAKCIMAQANADEGSEDGLAYSALGLLSFNPSKERNAIWEKLDEETKKNLDKRLLARTDYDNSFQMYNIAKAVARFSMGLSKKDETGKLIDRFVERIEMYSTAKFFDDKPDEGLAGAFDILGVASFVFIRQALQLHANIHLRDRKIPSLRTYAEKYLRILPDIVRADGLGWAFGKKIGAYGQMHLISMILQAMRDNWIAEDKMPDYMDILRRLFQFFFMTYIDQESGTLVIEDAERSASELKTTRLANFDAARYLCQWSRLAKSINRPMQARTTPAKTGGRYVSFDNTPKKEQGVFIYQNIETGLHVHLPIIASNGSVDITSAMTFPHMAGIFDWPSNNYLPIMTPELTFAGKQTVPSFYGKKCISGIGLRNAYFFKYEQPDLITKDGEILKDSGSCKVNWTFSGNKITGEFAYSVKTPTTLDKMRLVVAIAAPHSEHFAPASYTIGEAGLGIEVEKDDFGAEWKDTEIVSDDPNYKTYWGKIHYLQTLERDEPLVMRPGLQYKLIISFNPDIINIG
ncbi:MAG: hypothetical protein R3Y46_01275 [Opitutales bacterium]